MLICPYCKFENDINNIYCDECGKRLRKSRVWMLILILIIFFLIYPIISTYEIEVSVKKNLLVEEPYIIIREVTTQNPIQNYVCENRSYRFSILGGDVVKIGSYVRPNLVIINLEDKWGTYRVNLSFIDEAKFPYDIYGGEYLRESLEKGKISADDADFYSQNYLFLIGPGERISVDERIPSINPKNTYWAIADIIEPKYKYCYQKTTYVNVTENKTFTEYREVLKKVQVKEYRKITEIIGINNFIEWFILLFLLFLIIILLIRIKDKYYSTSV